MDGASGDGDFVVDYCDDDVGDVMMVMSSSHV